MLQKSANVITRFLIALTCHEKETMQFMQIFSDNWFSYHQNISLKFLVNNLTLRIRFFFLGVTLLWLKHLP